MREKHFSRHLYWRKYMTKLMFSLALSLAVLAIWPATTAQAQLADPGTVGVAMGHVHLAVQDIEATKKFWIAVGGAPAGKLGANEVVKFPGVLILIRKAMDPTAGTVGSVVNHIGFLVPNVAETRAKWQAAGLMMEPPNPANPKQIYVHTPDDLVRIEILEDAMQTVPIKFHHVHFFVTDSGGTNSVLAMQAWYAKTFGAKPGKRGQFDAADLPGVNLTFAKSDTPTVATKGRELDHIGFEIKNLQAFCKKAEAAGIKFDMPYTPRPDLGIALAFITDPWGTYIELNEGLNKL
jgi:catechol 2,3-dioxygenase-like lactoylglutathione lyase family enzyme